MTKQRMVKMTGGDQNILAKALRSAQEEAGPELSGQLPVSYTHLVGIEVTDAYYKLGSDRVRFALEAHTEAEETAR